MAPVAGGHVERENKVASGKKFECEERKKEMGGATRTDGPTNGQLQLRLQKGK